MFRRGTKGLEGLLQSWVVPLASAKEVTWSSTRSDEASGRTQATTHSGGTGVRARGCAATARRVARDPAARKAAQIKVRSKVLCEERRSSEVFEAGTRRRTRNIGRVRTHLSPLQRNVAYSSGRPGQCRLEVGACVHRRAALATC